MEPRAAHRIDGPVESAESLTEWRALRLREHGFDEELAASVAGDREFDLHALLDLVDRGCPPPLAVRIVAPLNREAPVA
jgi:hypothetical protein